MRIHVRVHRWVLWWFYIGVFCGVVAVINILGRHLSRTQEDVILLIGALHWLLGGLVCYAFDAIRIEESSPQLKDKEPSRAQESSEWRPASDFLLPGNKRSILPPRY
jgi:hypothetical protein